MKPASPVALILCLPALAAAQPAAEAHLRHVSILKTGTATALQAATMGTDGDARLFDRLMEEAAAGKARILADQELTAGSGAHSRTQTARRFPAPPAPAPDFSQGTATPDFSGFEAWSQSLEADLLVSRETEPGADRMLQDLTLGLRLRSGMNMRSGPAAADGGGGPRVALQRVRAQALTWTGNTLLLAVSPAATSAGGGPVFCYQFIRSDLTGEVPAPADARSVRTLAEQRRLHAVTLRLPRREAAAAILESDGNDAALYGKLSRRALSGGITLVNHCAVLCRQFQRSRLESFIKPAGQLEESVMESRAISPDFPGQTMEAGTDADGPGNWRVRLRQCRLPHGAARENPEAAAGGPPPLSVRKLSGSMILPASGILRAGAVSSSPATEPDSAGTPPGGATTDITFLLQTPPPSGQPEKNGVLPPAARLDALMLSLSAAEGSTLEAALRAAGGPVSAARLVSRFLKGGIPCLAQASVALTGGNWTSASDTLFPVPGILPEDLTGDPGMAAFSPGFRKAVESGASDGCGLSFTAHYLSGDRIPVIDFIWKWDTAPASAAHEPLPGHSASGTRPDPGVNAASGAGTGMFRFQERISRRGLALPRHAPVIADVRASGAGGNGSWQALVLLAR